MQGKCSMNSNIEWNAVYDVQSGVQLDRCSYGESMQLGMDRRREGGFAYIYLQLECAVVATLAIQPSVHDCANLEVTHS